MENHMEKYVEYDRVIKHNGAVSEWSNVLLC